MINTDTIFACSVDRIICVYHAAYLCLSTVFQMNTDESRINTYRCKNYKWQIIAVPLKSGFISFCVREIAPSLSWPRQSVYLLGGRRSSTCRLCQNGFLSFAPSHRFTLRRSNVPTQFPSPQFSTEFNGTAIIHCIGIWKFRAKGTVPGAVGDCPRSEN